VSLLDVGLLAVGALLLAYAGHRLVDFAAALAEKARLTPAVIGLTVVAAGTSAPELAVSVSGALRGSADIALGNVVGSNIANIGLILGGCAAVAAIPIARGVLRFEYPFLLLASWIVLLLSRDGRLDRLESSFFLASMAAFTGYAVWVARREISAIERQRVGETIPRHAESLSRQPAWRLLLGTSAALLGLVVGGDLLVRGAVGMAHSLGVSERVVGLTVVAIGTSLPELAVSLAAALKRQQEMAVANVVGSNVFNLLMILGVAGLVRPLTVDPRIASVDLWVMMGFTVLLLPLVLRRQTLSRAGGVCLLSCYLGYLAWLASSPR
jgi:cation:H+ antiporter